VTRPNLLTFPRVARHRDVRTAVRFLVVGGISTVVTIGLFNLLVHGGARPLLSTRPVTGYVLAMLAGLAVNYAGNRFWSFDTGHRGNQWIEIASFLITNAVAVGIPSACLAVSRYVLGLDSAFADNLSANVIGLVFATLARWLSYRYVVFGRRRQQAAPVLSDLERP
jgi:putative flippase GtrA